MIDTDASPRRSRKRPGRIFLTVLEVGIAIWLFGSMFILPVQSTPLPTHDSVAGLKRYHERIGARQDATMTAIELDMVNEDEPTADLGLWTSDTPDHTETWMEPSTHVYPTPTIAPTQDIHTFWHTELESSIETSTWIVTESALDHLTSQTFIVSETSTALPISSDIADNISSAGSSEPPMDPLALIPLFVVLGCGLLFWLFLKVKRPLVAAKEGRVRGRENEYGPGPRYKGVQGDDVNAQNGYQRLGPVEDYDSELDVVIVSASFATGTDQDHHRSASPVQRDRSGFGIGADVGIPDETLVSELNHAHIQSPKITIQLPTPSCTLRRTPTIVRFAPVDRRVFEREQRKPRSMWKQAFGRETKLTRIAEFRQAVAETLLAGKSYSKVGTTEPEVVAGGPQETTISPTVAIDSIPGLQRTPSSAEISVSFSMTSVGEALLPGADLSNSVPSPTESAISHYSGVSTLIPGYYFGPSAEKYDKTRPPRSPLGEGLPMTDDLEVSNSNSRVSLFVTTQNGETQAVLMRNKSTSTVATSCIGSPNGFRQLLSPVEPAGLRIITETPLPPVFETDSSSSSANSPLITPDSPLSETTAPLLSSVSSLPQPVVLRKVPLGARLMIRKNPDLKQVRYITPSDDAINHHTALASKASRSKKNSSRTSNRRKTRSLATASSQIEGEPMITTSLSEDWIDAAEHDYAESTPFNSRIFTGGSSSSLGVERTAVGLGITGQDSPFERLRSSQ